MLDVAAKQGWLVTDLNTTNLVQMLIQGRWLKDSSLLTLPNIEQHHLHLFRKWKPVIKCSHARCQTSIECLPELIHACIGKDHIFSSMVEKELQATKTKQAWNFLSHLPVIDVGISVKGSWNDLAEGHNELSVSTLNADKRDDNKWIRLHADQEYVLQVSLQRVHFGFHKWTSLQDGHGQQKLDQDGPAQVECAQGEREASQGIVQMGDSLVQSWVISSVAP
ncbi:activating signal cointegrator 1 complex subunit 3-like [Callospermophilus lateralis]|uniref:activating signal cointegrator 1 complex subunit 3-like n=1 Tax=Callospermophilus lateralis TaxID=76772 RepID=UPI004053B711